MCTLKGEQLAKGSSRAFCPNSYLAEGKPPDFAGDASEALALRQRGNLLFRRDLNDSNNSQTKAKTETHLNRAAGPKKVRRPRFPSPDWHVLKACLLSLTSCGWNWLQLWDLQSCG